MFVTDKSHGESTTIQHPSLAGFIAWLETMPRNREYPWRLTNVCACAQYGRATGTIVQWQNTGASTGVWEQINEIAKGDDTPSDWTFGKCLGRARAAA